MGVLLIRHAEPDWDLVADERWVGAANDLAPLTTSGRAQAAAAADDLRAHAPTLVLSSPMTRALQTAAVVAAALDLPLQVELDLREWLPDEDYRWASAHESLAAHRDMLAHDGVRPGPDRTWEPLAAVRERALAVLRPHLESGATVVAVTHEVLIHAVTGHPQTAHAAWRPVDAGAGAIGGTAP